MAVYAIVNDEGYQLDEVSIEEYDEVGNKLDIEIPHNYVPPNYTKRLHVPRWDFDKKEWVEGLTPEEVEQREIEIQEENNKITDEEMNAIAIMELAQIVMGGK